MEVPRRAFTNPWMAARVRSRIDSSSLPFSSPQVPHLDGQSHQALGLGGRAPGDVQMAKELCRAPESVPLHNVCFNRHRSPADLVEERARFGVVSSVGEFKSQERGRVGSLPRLERTISMHGEAYGPSINQGSSGRASRGLHFPDSDRSPLPALRMVSARTSPRRGAPPVPPSPSVPAEAAARHRAPPGERAAHATSARSGQPRRSTPAR